MYKVTLKVNGNEVHLTDFPSQIISNILIGILKSLKDVIDIEDAVFELKKEH